MIFIDLTVSTPPQHAALCKALGKKIKEARASRKMSQMELASLCNFEKSNLSRIESGATNPTFLTLYKIAAAIGVPVAQLVDGVEKVD